LLAWLRSTIHEIAASISGVDNVTPAGCSKNGTLIKAF
jgi:hypothetical protein